MASEDKGKGKANAEDTSDYREDVKMNENERESTGGGDQSDPGVERSRADLQLLADLAPSMVERLVDLDPTPTSQLLTTTKIMKAISVLTSACSMMQEDGPLPGEGSNAIPLDSYADVLELLSSALSDVSQSMPHLRSAPKPVSLHHLEVARAKLALPLEDPVPPAGPPGIQGALIITPLGVASGVVGETRLPPSELALLYAENARLALATLRPPSLFPSPLPSTQTSSLTPSGRVSPAPPIGASPISTLPSEIILYILQFVHASELELARQPSPRSSSSSSSRSSGVTEIWTERGRRSLRDEFGNPQKTSGPDVVAQKTVLALGRVCKAWLEPARAVAFRHLHLPQSAQASSLLSTLNSSDSLQRSLPAVRAISAVLGGSSDTNANPTAAALNRVIGRFPTRRARFTPTPAGPSRSDTDREGSNKASGDDGKSPAETWSQLVGLCTSVKDIKLEIVPSPQRWSGFGHSASTTEFLDAAVLGALSSTRSLTNLNLNFSIDFEELELIMNGLPNLEDLSVRAIEAISGSTAVGSTAPHPARNIRRFRLGDNSQTVYGGPEYTAISDVQLAWLLEPAVANGSLKVLEVFILIDPGLGGWNPHGPGGQGANVNTPPFASSTIADLLVRCGGNLDRLVLQDLGQVGGVNPNFAAYPHSSNFDHALSTLTSLRYLSVQFAYTGPDLITSLSSMSNLVKLCLSGTPIHTSADLFADKLEHGFGSLEGLTFDGAGQRGGQGGWNGAGVRKVTQAAKARGMPNPFGG
ncbi:hypothetical protein JCM16303_006858 [Sporobolomyces ruberrimus]